VGIILLRNYLQAFRGGGTGGREGGGNEGRGGRPVVVWVYDAEVGWKEAVSETTRCLQSVGIHCKFDQVSFEKCDCILALDHPSNEHLHQLAPTLDLVGTHSEKSLFLPWCWIILEPARARTGVNSTS
jgi:hypothetical protein